MRFLLNFLNIKQTPQSRTVVMKHKERGLIINFVIVQVGGKELSFQKHRTVIL